MNVSARFIRLLFILLFGLLLNPAAHCVPATEIEAYDPDLSPEDLAWLEIPEVVTPARRAQPITEAPSSVSVITAEEIRRSGLTNIPDILRRLAGVDVMALSPSDINVGIRGMNAPASNKILVMIDGRSVYMDFYGTTIWSTLPILLDEIARIEVVRGPGSSLYGANAFSGVINIITKTPREQKDTLVSAAAGTKRTYEGTAITAGELGELGYKLSLGWKEQGFWEDPDRKALENLIANGVINYLIDPEKELRLGAGVNSGSDYLGMSESQGFLKLDGYVSYLNAAYYQPNLTILSYWNRGEADTSSDRTGENKNLRYNTYHLELQYAFDRIPYNHLIVGGSYRYNTVASQIINHGQHQNISALFFQDEVYLTDSIRLVVGSRLDYNSLIDDSRFSPRGSLIFSPHPDHAVRLSVSKAYRDPTFLETDFDTSSIIDPLYPEFPIHIFGNPDLVPEKILAYEAGWSGVLTSFLKVRTDIFYNRIDNLIEGLVTSRYPVFPFFPRETTFINNDDPVRAIGGEVGAEFRICRWLDGFINYSYQELKNTRTDEIVKTAPKNKINAGLNASPGAGWTATIAAHYVDKTTWETLREDREIDDYILTNARLAYTLPDPDLELALSVFNLFNDKHQEHPLGEKIGQRILFTTSLNF